MKVSRECEVSRCLFSLSFCHTNCSSKAAKDSFYDTLRALLQRAESSDIGVVAGDMNAQVGRLSTDEAQLGGCLGLDSVRMDNGERLLQLCADHNLFYTAQTFATNGPV